MILRDQTIRQRAAVTAMMVTGLISVLVYVGVLAFIHLQVASRLSNDLTITARQVSALAAAGRLGNPVITGGHEFVQVQNDQGKVVTSTQNLAGAAPLPARRPTDRNTLQQRVCVDNGRHCLTVIARRVDTPRDPLTVLSIAPVPGLFPEPGLAVLLALGIPVSIGISGVWRWWATGRRLRPVEALRDELEAINAADLRGRVSLPPRRDEFYGLATAVNSTLDRLKAAVEQQRRLVSDVSHDLRSPIAGLRAELEVALIDPEDTDLREALGRTLKNTERLQNIVTELLALARRDAGMSGRSGPVDLGELAEREVRRVPRRIKAEVIAESGVIARANPLDVGRVLTNLLDNAARHAESMVRVTVRRGDGEAILEMFNDGKQIPPDDRERIFERFTRLADARERDPGGSGLGLAISREIANTNGGSLTVADSDEGACFVLRLPLMPE